MKFTFMCASESIPSQLFKKNCRLKIINSSKVAELCNNTNVETLEY